jgi:hypothetical protein
VRRRSTVLLKIDIAKAFNTVNWAFLLELLCRMGFSRRWVNWVSILLSTANTNILSQLPAWAPHPPCLRQGDPLSPLLFVIGMEALNSLVALADRRGLFTPLRSPNIPHHLSLYADDLVVFVAPGPAALARPARYLHGSIRTSHQYIEVSVHSYTVHVRAD